MGDGCGQLRGPPRGGRRAQAVAARRRARPDGRPPADGAPRRGGARPRRGAASSVARFCKGIVDAVGPYVVAVKPQSAFFEALGSDGVRALEEVCEYARCGRPARPPRREARRHRLDGAWLRDGVSRAARGRGRRSRTRSRRARTSARTRWSPSSPPAGATAPVSSSSSARRTPARRTSRTSRSPTPVRSGTTSRSSCANGASRSSGREGMSSVGAVVGRHAPAGGVGRAPAPASHADAAAGSRRAGRDARRRRARIHCRSRERARHRLALRDLRVPRERGRLAHGCGGGGAAARRTGVGGSGLVAAAVDFAPLMRRALLAAVALFALLAVPLRASGADGAAGSGRRVVPRRRRRGRPRATRRGSRSARSRASRSS